jgi:hypothetical protein
VRGPVDVRVAFFPSVVTPRAVESSGVTCGWLTGPGKVVDISAEIGIPADSCSHRYASVASAIHAFSFAVNILVLWLCLRLAVRRARSFGFRPLTVGAAGLAPLFGREGRGASVGRMCFSRS